MYKNILSFCAFTLFASLLQAQPIRIATYRYAENDRLKNIQPFTEYLEKKYGIQSTLTSYPTIHDFILAIQDDKVDVALINTFGYLLLQISHKKYPMEPLLALRVEENAKDNYKTAVVAASNSPIRLLKNIKKYARETRFSLVAEGSTSGNLVPRLAFTNAGIKKVEKEFLSFNYAGTHAAAIEDILNGRSDLAAMGYTEYQKYLAKDSLNAARMHLVWLSPEIPLGPVLFNKKLTAADRMLIEKAFLELQSENPLALSSIKAGWSEAKQAEYYVKIDDSFYDPFRKALGKKADLQRILNQFAK